MVTGGPEVAERLPGKGLRLAFRILAGVFGLLTLVFSVPFAVASFLDEEQEIHLVHNLAGLAVYGVILGAGLLLLARRPDEHDATFLGLALASVGALVGGALSGDLVAGLWFAPAVVVVVLFALHPERGRLVRPGTVRVALLTPAAVAAVPLVAYALTQSSLQADGAPANPHVEFHHYSGMAAGALMLLLFLLAPGLGSRGWRVAAWLAGIATAIVGASSLAYGDHESALDGAWAWAALAGGIVLVGIAEGFARAERGSAA